MRKLEEQILTGEYRRIDGKLSFSVRLAELSAAPGEAAEGTFTIFASQEEIPAQGYVLTNDERMECRTEWFNGVQEQIVYRFHADGMQNGDSRQGQFLIVSDYGEYTLPWKVTVQEKAGNGEVTTLAGFTELARTDWKTAVQLFYSRKFEALCQKESEKAWMLYRGLSAGYYNSANVETFLVASGCKQALTFSPVKRELQVKDVQETVREELQILKNGWGPVSLQLQTEGDFLFLEKNRIGEDDFLGNLCRIPVYISEEKLHDGKNFGKVTVCWERGSFAFQICASGPKTRLSAETARRNKEKKCGIRLTQLYLKLRAKQIDLASWQGQVRECVGELAGLEPKSAVPKLFGIHLLLTENKTEEAGGMLKQIRPMLEGESPAVVCYYLYLTTLYDKREEYGKRAAARVAEIYARYPEEWRIAWLQLFLSRDLNRSVYRKWQFLQEQFQKGCVSPLLYQEAILLLNADPALLTGLDPAVRRVLVYGARKGILNENLCGQAAELACREKYFDPLLFEILERCWEKKPSSAVLQAICSLLIKGGKCEPKWHVWYERGVQSKLRVTRLYEYYLLSTDLTKDIESPKSVLLYFAYQCNLDWEYAAWLYACVERQKEKDPELYITYKPEMDRFLLDCLNKGRINRHLAFLYQKNLPSLPLDREQGETIVSMIGSTEIVLNQKESRKLVVVHRRVKGEEAYWLQDGCACVPLYDPEDLIFLEEEDQKRTPVTEYDRKKELITFQELAGCWGIAALQEWGADSIAFLLEAEKKKPEGIDQAGVRMELCSKKKLEDAYGQELRCSLALWLEEQERTKELDRFLRTLTPEQIAEKDRLRLARLMILRHFYNKAYEWLAGGRFEEIDPAELMRLCSRLLAKERHIGEKRLTLLCAQAALNGKYDGLILQYLADEYEGSCSELEAILQAAKNFGTDIWRINQKLLVQLLFTGQDVTERMDLLRDYIGTGGSPELEEIFLHRCAYAYVILKQPIHRYMVQMILRLCRWGADVSRLCKIAALQYYAKNKALLEEKERGQIGKIVRQLFAENCRIPVMQQFYSLAPQIWPMLDQSFVLYEGEPKKQLVLHYRKVEGDRAEAEYHEMELPGVCDGIYAAGFVLFPGERIQYYITELERVDDILDSGMLCAGEQDAEAMRGRYARLYEMAQAQLMQEDLQTKKELTKDYLYTSFCTKQLFGMLE